MYWRRIAQSTAQGHLRADTREKENIREEKKPSSLSKPLLYIIWELGDIKISFLLDYTVQTNKPTQYPSETPSENTLTKINPSKQIGSNAHTRARIHILIKKKPLMMNNSTRETLNSLLLALRGLFLTGAGGSNARGKVTNKLLGVLPWQRTSNWEQKTPDGVKPLAVPVSSSLGGSV